MARKVNDSKQSEPVTQADKFKALARELEADEDPEAFKAKLRKVATAPRQSKPPAKP